MRIKRVSRVALLCAGVSAFAVPALAYAQAGAENSSSDIIVTATRRAEKLQDVSMSVNVATGEQLEKFKIFDIKDVSQLAPGLELSNSTGRNNTTTLRGITFDPDQGTAPAVQVYLNEIPADAQTVYTAMYDIGQIEVLRGPQGLLRGLSAPAGSITITTRRPNFDAPEGYAQATATDRAGYNVQFGASLPFNDKLAIRLAGVVDGNRLNHVRNVNRNGERSRSRTESVRGTLGWKPTEDFTAYLTYQYLYADNRQFQQVIGSGNTPFYLDGFDFAQPSYGFGFIVAPDPSVSSGPPLSTSDYKAVQEGVFRNRNETHIVNLVTDWDLGPATLSVVAAHQFTKLNISRDLDTGNAVPGYAPTSTVVTPYKVDTAEIRLSSNNDEGFGWGVGAFYQKQTGTTVVNQAQDTIIAPTLPLTLSPLDLRIVVPVDTSTWSFNGNLRYKTGPLTVTGGLRYSIMKNTQVTSIFFDPLPASIPSNPIVDGPFRGNEKPITGGATVNYAFSPALNAYFSYGHSFRAGSHAVAAPTFISNDLVQTSPEKTDSFEIGLKGSALDRKIDFTVAAFYQKLDNFLNRFTGIHYNVVRFGGAYQATGSFDFNYNTKATVKGVEAEINARPTPDWDLNISGSYAKARFDNATVPCNTFDANGNPTVVGTGDVSYCTTSGRMAEVPDFTLRANTEIRFPMGSVTPYIRALLDYRPGFHSERVNYNYRDRELLNLFLGVRSDDAGWGVELFARNVLNQKRITNISAGNSTMSTYCAPGYYLNPALCNGSGLTLNSGYRGVNVMNPRELGATLSFKW